MLPKSLQFAAAALVLTLTVCRCTEYCNQNRTWLKFQDNCYLFETRSGSKLQSYYDAEDYCRGLDAHLVSIHSKAENDFLNEASSKHYYGGRQWIGLNDVDNRNDYKWSDGSSVDFLKLANKTDYFKESCFVFYKPEGGWRREHCELRHTAICKKSARDVGPTTLPPPTPLVGNCPKGWLKYGQKCYKYFGQDAQDRKKFKQAKLACNSLGENHDLVSIHSAEEQAFVTYNLHDLGAPAWIGFSQISSDEIGHELVFGWTDNSRVNYTFWAPGHPQRGTWKNCVALGYEGVGKGEWVGDYCDIHPKGYICQRPLDADLPPVPPQPSECGSNGLKYRNSCYYFHDEEKTWADANSTCIAEGANLVSILDSFEQSLLYNHVSRDSWIGLKTITGTRIFKWSDKQPFYYSNWIDGQPSLKNLSDPHCVLLRNTADRAWDVRNCNVKLPFICESSNEIPPVYPGEVIGKCPNASHVDIGDAHCYHIVEESDSRTQWGSLTRYCITKGMELVSLHSEHQVKSLMTYLWKKPYDYWLGLIRKEAKKNNFIWSDGSLLNYTNWADREPSSWSSDSDCVGFSTRDSEWYVKKCSDWSGSMCKTKKLL